MDDDPTYLLPAINFQWWLCILAL